MTLILKNARIVGTDAPTTLAIRDGLLANADDVASAEEVDLDGRHVMPGLWDTHVHMEPWARQAHSLDLSEATSAEDAVARIAAALPGHDPNQTLVATGIRPALWPHEPTVAMLDRATGDQPVVVLTYDVHSAWANTPALATYGLGIARHGMVREREAFRLQRALDDIDDAVLDRWIAQAAWQAAARGVVGVVDVTMSYTPDAWRRRMAAGFDVMRVAAGTYPGWLDQAIAAGRRTGDVDPDFPLLSTGPLKIISDGTLNSHTAYCREPYPARPDHKAAKTPPNGALNLPPAELEDLMRRASEAGLRLAVHAVGDLANTTVLDAFERTGAHGSVEHAQLLDDADVPRFAALGVVASVQPQQCLDDRAVVPRVWPGREARTYRFRDLLDAGATLSFGSDAPVCRLDPWQAIQAAVERALPGEQPWHPEQALTATEALRASTNGVWGLQPGAPADLAILDADPLTARGAQLRQMPVAATLVAGQFTHRAW